MTTIAPKLATGTPATYARALPLGKCATLADPELIEQHRALVAWPAVIARWRGLPWVERFGHEAPALPRYAGKSVGSPQLVQAATLDAEADIDRDIHARLTDGRLRVLAFQEPRRLGDDPVVLPVQLVATATAVNWRQGTIAAGGMRFLEARAIPAEDLPAAESEPDTPPATLGRLVEVLTDLFHEERAWAKAGDARLAEIVAARDHRFQPHTGPARHGRWNERTLKQKIKETRAEAKVEAGI